MANKITFETGIKEYEINDDPNKILRVNMADENLVAKMRTSLRRARDKVKEIESANIIDSDGGIDLIVDTDTYLREEFDTLFYPGAAQTVFGDMHLMSLTDGGTSVYENFLEAFIPMVAAELQEKGNQSQKRVDKYKAEAKALKES